MGTNKIVCNFTMVSDTVLKWNNIFNHDSKFDANPRSSFFVALLTIKHTESNDHTTSNVGLAEVISQSNFETNARKRKWCALFYNGKIRSLGTQHE